MTEQREFTGWVEHIYPAGEYGQEFTVRDYRDDADKPKYPTVLKFNASNKCKGQLVSMNVGDKVRISYFIYGVSGEGRNGYYCIVRLNIAKDGGVTILEAIPKSMAHDRNKDEKPEEADEELPF